MYSSSKQKVLNFLYSSNKNRAPTLKNLITFLSYTSIQSIIICLTMWNNTKPLGINSFEDQKRPNRIKCSIKVLSQWAIQWCFIQKSKLTSNCILKTVTFSSVIILCIRSPLVTRNLTIWFDLSFIYFSSHSSA